MYFREAVRRLLMAVLVLLTLLYPVRSFFGLPLLPLWVKGLWLCAGVVAILRPRWAVVAFLAGAPLLAVLPALHHWPSVALASAWVWTLLLATWGRSIWCPAAPRLPYPALLLLLLASASLLVTLYPLHLARDGMADLLLEVDRYLREELIVATSQRPVLSPLRAWMTLAEGIGLIWVIRCAFRDGLSDGWCNRLALAVAVGGAAVGVWAVDQWWTRDHLLEFWTEQDPYITRVNASFTDVNALGAYLASVVALVIVVTLWRQAVWWRAGWSVLTACVLLGVVFTGSRVAWLAAACSVSALLIGMGSWRLGIWSDKRQRQLRTALVAGAAALLVGLLSVIAWAGARDVRLTTQRNYVDTLLFTFNMRAPLSERLKGRGDLWQAAGDMIAARPLTGIGLGRYYKDLAAWVPDPAALPRAQENAHNYFLQMGAELGLPGLLSLLCLMGIAIVTSMRVVTRLGPLQPRRVALASALGVMAFAITCLTGHSLLLPEGQLTFWGLAGIAQLQGRAGTAAAVTSRRSTWVVAATVALLVATLPVRSRTEIGRVDWLRLTMGFHEEEKTSAGESFRWTSGRAIFHVPDTAKVVSFHVRSVAPFSQTLQVKYAGRVIQQVSLSDHDWRPLRYVLPRMSSREPFRRFELLVTPTWEPLDDARELGVMVSAIESSS